VNWKKIWKTAHQGVEVDPPSWPFDVWKLCELEENLENSPSARPIRAWELIPLHGLSMCGNCVNWTKMQGTCIFLGSSVGSNLSFLQLLTPPHCDAVSWWKEELKRWLRMKWQVMACIPR